MTKLFSLIIVCVQWKVLGMVNGHDDESYDRRKSKSLECQILLYISMKNETFGTTKLPKERKECDTTYKLTIQKYAKAKKILIYSICLDEYNRILACPDEKVIQNTLQTTHEGTSQLKKSNFDKLNRQYELFKMMEGETIHDMQTAFTSIINEIYSFNLER